MASPCRGRSPCRPPCARWPRGKTSSGIYADKSPSDALTPDQQTTAEAEIADKRWRETLKKRIQRMREDLEALSILGVTRHDAKTYVYWTGKPLRAFPETQPRAKIEAEDSAPIADVEFD